MNRRPFIAGGALLAALCALPWWRGWLQPQHFDLTPTLAAVHLVDSLLLAYLLLVVRAQPITRQALGLRFLLFALLPGWNWFLWCGAALSARSSVEATALLRAEDPWQQQLTVSAAFPPLTAASTAEQRADRVRQEIDFPTLAEIFYSGHHGLMRNAIDRLVHLRTPAAIALLQAHRQHPSAEIRFFVTTGLTRIKQAFEEAIDAARIAVQHAAPVSAADDYQLGRAMLRYAQSGLLEPALRHDLESAAERHLRSAHLRDPEQLHPLRALLALARQQNRWDQAGEYLAHLRQHRTVTAERWAEAQCDIALARGDLPTLLRTFTELPHPLPRAWAQQLVWWRGA